MVKQSIRETPQRWLTAVFFGERPPLGGEKETLPRQDRDRQEITASLAKIKSAVSNFLPFIESKLKKYLIARCDTFAAGCIGHSLGAWKEITSDREIISTVMGLKIDFDEPPQQQFLPTCKRPASEEAVIDLEVKKLLSKSVIEPTGHSHGEIISDVFVRVKKDGGHRMILNLKNLNQYANKLHFKMDTLNTIIKLVEKDCFMASIDLKDAYYSVPIAKSHRKYLRFFWREQLYQFTCLPNGLSCGPRKFTKLLKPALTELHLKGHISSGYIDDLYLQGKTYDACVHNVIDTVIQIDTLGLVTHPEKSVFNPSQQLVILGFLLNSVKMTIKLTREKALALQTACTSLLNTASPTIREVARVLGKIVSSFPGVMYGPLYYRHIEYDKTCALRNHRWNFDRRMSLSANAKTELEWWTANVMTAENVMTRGQPSCELMTDASNEGWGAVCGPQSTGGLWTSDEKRHHINYLELLAVFLGLKALCTSHRDRHISLKIDNTTAVAVINHMGTSHSGHLNKLCKEIWDWCIARNLWISAGHIAGKANVEADLESRQNQTMTEWMLNTSLFSQSLKTLQFAPDIDLFASRLNKQLPNYVAYRPDPDSIAIDAFTMNWAKLKFYAFPPFSVIAAVLKKIQEDKATGICVLPNWPTQAWFPKAMKMTVQEPVVLEASKTLLHLPSQPTALHPLHKKLTLLVCHLSGRT